VVETDDVLLWQAVNQIDREALEAELTRRLDDQLRLFEALDTIHRLLHARIEILHTDAHAVEAKLGQQLHRLAIHLARVHLDGVFAVRQHAEMLPGHLHQPAHFIVREEGRRTAAPVQLHDIMRAIECRRL
jgi:hypothetical protein